jgi:hypothetical protein
VAVTAADAKAAIAAGQDLLAQVAAAEKLPDAELEAALAGLKTAVDVAVSSRIGWSEMCGSMSVWSSIRRADVHGGAGSSVQQHAAM